MSDAMLLFFVAIVRDIPNQLRYGWTILVFFFLRFDRYLCIFFLTHYYSMETRNAHFI